MEGRRGGGEVGLEIRNLNLWKEINDFSRKYTPLSSKMKKKKIIKKNFERKWFYNIIHNKKNS